MANWTHKVVKIARGMDGQWFAFPAAVTFDNEMDARQYAIDFAREQSEAGIVGVKITVRTRKGGKNWSGGTGATIANYPVNPTGEVRADG